MSFSLSVTNVTTTNVFNAIKNAETIPPEAGQDSDTRRMIIDAANGIEMWMDDVSYRIDAIDEPTFNVSISGHVPKKDGSDHPLYSLSVSVGQVQLPTRSATPTASEVAAEEGIPAQASPGPTNPPNPPSPNAGV